MSIYNRELVKRNGTARMPTEAFRGTGRTTTIILKALIESLNNPNEPIKIMDHAIHSSTPSLRSEQGNYLFRRTLEIIDALDFRNVSVSITGHTVTIVNTNNIIV